MDSDSKRRMSFLPLKRSPQLEKRLSPLTAGEDRRPPTQYQKLEPDARSSCDTLILDPATHVQASTPNHSRQKANLKSERIPRPANAFILFRSDLLARGIIPFDIECHQQKLSRVAGQCWNLLSQDEKELWESKAKQVLAEHLKRYPNYKYTPAPRGSRRPKSSGHSGTITETADSEDRIRKIREEYVQILGPSASPAKRSRRKVRDQASSTEAKPVAETPLPLPNEIPSTPLTWSPVAHHENNKEVLLSPLALFSPQHLPQITLTPAPPSSAPLALPTSKRAEYASLGFLNLAPESRPITPLLSTCSKSHSYQSDVYLPTLDESFHTFLPTEDSYEDSETIDGSASSSILSAITLPMLTLEDYSPLSDLGELDLSEFDTEWNGF